MIKAFAPIATPQSRILILGTMPGEKSLQLQEYYGNRGNRFWSIMFAILGREFSQDYNERLQLLKDNNIALWDVLAFCHRQGSLDSNIKNEVSNDFVSFYKAHPGITHVFFSSKNAAEYYDKHVGRREGLTYAVLPSPSGAYAGMPFAQKLEMWRQNIMPVLNI